MANSLIIQLHSIEGWALILEPIVVRIEEDAAKMALVVRNVLYMMLTYERCHGSLHAFASF